MEAELLLKGFVIGMAIAAPVGPIGLLCIKKSIENGRLSGFVSGMGAATADMIYGMIAAFGLTALTSVLTGAGKIIGIIGGIFLVYLGVQFFRKKPSEISARKVTKGTLMMDYLLTVALTLTNPMTILSFIAIFGGLGAASGSGYQGAAFIVAGVFTGSAAWWLILSLFVGGLRKKVKINYRIVNKIAGAVVAGFGIIGIVKNLGII